MNNTKYIVQGDLAFWHYSVYGVYSTYSDAKHRLNELVDELPAEELDRLSDAINMTGIVSKRYKGLRIIPITLDKPENTLPE